MYEKVGVQKTKVYSFESRGEEFGKIFFANLTFSRNSLERLLTSMAPCEEKEQSVRTESLPQESTRHFEVLIIYVGRPFATIPFTRQDAHALQGEQHFGHIEDVKACHFARCVGSSAARMAMLSRACFFTLRIWIKWRCDIGIWNQVVSIA